MLGGEPDVHVIARLEKGRRDPLYGSMMKEERKKQDDPEADALIEAAQGVEIWALADAPSSPSAPAFSNVSVLVVARGRLPTQLLQREWAKSAMKTAPERLPSGAMFYSLAMKDTQPQPQPQAEGALVILPSGTWVLAIGRVVGRVRYHFFSQSADPPPALHEPDAIFALWVGPGVMKLVPAGSEDALGGLSGGAIVLRTSDKGDFEIHFAFKDEDHARRALDTVMRKSSLSMAVIKRRLEDKCPAWSAVNLDLHQDGPEIVGRISNMPPLVRAYRSGACRYATE